MRKTGAKHEKIGRKNIIHEKKGRLDTWRTGSDT